MGWVLRKVCCAAAVTAAMGLGVAAAQERGLLVRMSAGPTAAAADERIGLATWYGEDFDGRVTASGERFDMYGLTAADRALPFNSVVEVTNLENGRSVNVRITDRPSPGRRGLIVLSKAAAANLGFGRGASAPVRVRYLGLERHASAGDSTPRSRW